MRESQTLSPQEQITPLNGKIGIVALEGIGGEARVCSDEQPKLCQGCTWVLISKHGLDCSMDWLREKDRSKWQERAGGDFLFEKFLLVARRRAQKTEDAKATQGAQRHQHFLRARGQSR